MVLNELRGEISNYTASRRRNNGYNPFGYNNHYRDYGYNNLYGGSRFNNRINSDRYVKIFEDAKEEELYRNIYSGLNKEQRDFFSAQENKGFREELLSNATRNPDPCGAIQIAKYKIRELIDSKVEKIIDSLTNPCAKYIFNGLRKGIKGKHILNLGTQVTVNGTTLNFSESILKLFNDSKKTDYTIKNGNISNVKGGIVAGETYKTTTTISNSYLKMATRLSVAKKMIHEMVHAYLNGVIRRSPGIADEPFRTKLKQYATKHGYTGIGRTQHEFMGQYVNAIAYSLYEWDRDYGGGGNLSWNYYHSMAFSGFYYEDKKTGKFLDTNSFKKLVPNKANRNKIKTIIKNEATGNSKAKGTKC
jgi:hypothetical protein